MGNKDLFHVTVATVTFATNVTDEIYPFGNLNKGLFYFKGFKGKSRKGG